MRRWWQRRTLRFRLALWYAAGGALLLSIFSATIFLYVSQRMARPLDHQLRRDLTEVQARLTVGKEGADSLGRAQGHVRLAVEMERSMAGIVGRSGKPRLSALAAR